MAEENNKREFEDKLKDKETAFNLFLTANNENMLEKLKDYLIKKERFDNFVIERIASKIL